jgi:hypothetical protein
MRSSSLLFGLVPLLGVAELGLHEYFSRRAPDFDEYAALAPRLLESKPPGVPVVVAPSWAEPLVRQAAPAAFPLAELARADDSSYPSFLEVSLLGERAPELDGFVVQSTRQVGKFRLSVRRNPNPDPVRFDFVTAVERGEVEVFADRDGQRAACPLTSHAHTQTGGLHGHVAYPRQRYECGAGGFVGVTLVEDAGYRPHRCVIARLPDAGRIVIHFDSVPSAPRLRGFAGFSYFLERDDVTETVELRVSEAGQELGRHRVAGVRGWTRFELRRGDRADGIEVGVSRLAPGSADVCFALEAR